MAQLNPNKTYEPTPPPKVDPVEVPENWLDELDKLIAQPEHFKRHCREDSTYTNKSLLLDSMKAIYARLINVKTTEDEKQAILSKLREGIANCTPGFHDRANEIIVGFHVPTSIDEYLERIRRNIVTTAAIQTTNEVHSYNRFFTIGQQFGVRAINPTDIYAGQINDHEIESILIRAFAQSYNAFNIINTLYNELDEMLYVLNSQTKDNTASNIISIDVSRNI